MPVTPLHVGIPGLLSLYFPKKFDMVSGILASVIVDLNFLLIFFGYQIHGVLHNYIAAVVLAMSVFFAVIILDKPLSKLKKILKYTEETNHSAIFNGAFMGTLSHVFLDSLLYREMYPLYPYPDNPFYIGSFNMPILIAVYAITVITTFGFIILYDKKYYRSLGWKKL